jgi:hypothetical protein
MLMLEDDTFSARVKHTVNELLEGAEQLKGLAETLDGFCGLSANAEPEEIKQVAIGVRATAVQTLLMASTAVGLSERLSTVAVLLNQAEPVAERPPSPLDAPGKK